MTDFIIAFIAAPIFVVGVGYVAYRLNERSVRHIDQHRHPAE